MRIFRTVCLYVCVWVCGLACACLCVRACVCMFVLFTQQTCTHTQPPPPASKQSLSTSYLLFLFPHHIFSFALLISFLYLSCLLIPQFLPFLSPHHIFCFSHIFSLSSSYLLFPHIFSFLIVSSLPLSLSTISLHNFINQLQPLTSSSLLSISSLSLTLHPSIPHPFIPGELCVYVDFMPISPTVLHI